jgi:hypothetical protein
MQDFFSSYLHYVRNTEPPAFFHRWSMIASVGALLERNYYFEHGHFSIYPNIYCMLIGVPGTRKSTAIKLAVKTLKTSGYNTFAAEKTSKEKFILDLAEGRGLGDGQDILDTVLFGESASSTSPCFIAADEFNDFFGNNNLEFISLLGSLWDYSGAYESRLKNSKSVVIHNPTISILGGNTPTAFSLAFPVEVLGQGFFSRILLIYADPSGKRFTFPETPSAEETEEIKGMLQRIKIGTVGAAQLTSGARKLLDKIYKSNLEVNDVRFASYNTRRFTHLLKLCLIHSAAKYSKVIDEDVVVKANTVLHFTERFMPKALGEFGKSKHSDVTHKVVSIIEGNYRITTFKEIWSQVYNDLDKMSDLGVMLQNLLAAGKIQQIREPTLGYLPVRSGLIELSADTVDWNYLSEEERKMES